MQPEPHGVAGVAAGGDEDSWSWLVTFSDLVLQLFGFAIIAALAGGVVARTASAPQPSASEPALVAAVPAPQSASPFVAEPAPAAGTGAASDVLPPRDAGRVDPDALPAPTQAAAVSEPAAVDASAAASQDERPVPVRADRMASLGGYLEHLLALRPALGATVRVQRDAVVLQIGELAGFGPGSADPSPALRPLLAELRALVGAASDLHIEVSGHTDDVPIKNASFPSNLELSLARASRVASELAGSDATLRARVSAAGYAEQRPVASNADPEGRARNRRVEIRLTRPG